MIDVTDFGAVCDGKTDSTAAIQAALNAGVGNKLHVHFIKPIDQCFPNQHIKHILTFATSLPLRALQVHNKQQHADLDAIPEIAADIPATPWSTRSQAPTRTTELASSCIARPSCTT